MIANSINRAFGRASLRGVARVYTRLSQLSRVRSSTLLATRPWRVCGGGENARDSTGDRVLRRVHVPSVRAGGVAQFWARS